MPIVLLRPHHRKRRIAGRPQSGGSVLDILKKLNTIARESKIISTGLRHTNHPYLSKAASLFGYGRRRRPRR